MNEPMGPDGMRVSDAERALVARRLQWAQGEGLLDLGEYDERSQQLWASKTRGELSHLVRDLPEAPAGPAPVPAQRRPAVYSTTGGGTAMKVLTIIFTSIGVVNVAAWGIVSVTVGDVLYPWFLWTVVPLVVLGVLYLFGIGRPRGR